MKLFYNNYLKSASVVSSTSAQASYPVSNILQDTSLTFWRPTTTATQTIVYDLGSAQRVEAAFVSFPKHLCTDFTTKNCAITLEGSTTSNFASVGVSVVLTAPLNQSSGLSHNDFAFNWATLEAGTYSFRYWRVIFSSIASTNLSVSNIFLGKKFEFAQNGFDVKFTESILNTSIVNTNYLGRKFVLSSPVTQRAFGLSISTMNKTELESWRDTIVYAHQKTVPFWIAIDTGTYISSSLPMLTSFVYAESIGELSHETFGIWNTTLSCSEVI